MNPKTGAVLIGIGIFFMLLINIRWGEIPGIVRAYIVLGLGMVSLGTFFATFSPRSDEAVVGLEIIYHAAGGIAAAVIIGSFFVWVGGTPFWNIADEDWGERALKDFRLEGQVLMDESAGLILDLASADVRIVGWGNPELAVNGTLRVYAGTKEKAEERLGHTDVALSRETREGQPSFTIEVTGAEPRALGREGYRLSLTVFVPSQTEMELDVNTASGDIELEGVKLGDANLGTFSGGISLEAVEGRSLNVSVLSGNIRGNLTVESSHLSTWSGRIVVALGKQSGAHEIVSRSGNVDVSVPVGADVGLSAKARTTSGRASVLVENIEYTIDKTSLKEAQTAGYDSMEVRIAVDARTVSGNVHIRPS